MKHIFCSFIALLSVTATSFALHPSDQKAINQIIDNFTKVWNDQEGHGFAEHYCNDADFVNIFGMIFLGKNEIEERHIKILKTFLKGSTFEVLNIRLREATSDVIIAHVEWKVSNTPPSKKDSLNEMKGIFTHVFLKNDDRWKITATQNTLISKP
jgi:uncharacterized protein (TIGR02246 family)